MTKNSLSSSPSITTTDTQSLASGLVLDNYIIERVLAQGGFSTVYLARQLKDQQQVAIKEYKPEHLTVRNGLNVAPIDANSTWSRVISEGSNLINDHKTPQYCSRSQFLS
jgi:serine/threonine protein kinase